MSEIVLSRKVDKFVKPNRWIASLSNGETIFEDSREGVGSSWERLAQYVEAEKLSITKLRLQLGPLEVPLPDHQEGYIQIKKFWTTGAESDLCYKVGYVQGGLALIHEVSAKGYSRTYTGVADPGAPITIYRSKSE